MRDLLRGISIGVLFATGILAYAYYTNSPKTNVVEKEYTIEDAITYLQKQDYEVIKKENKVESNTPDESAKSGESQEDNKQSGNTQEETIKEYKLVIEKGMISQEVAEILYKYGIVDDAKAFNAYLGEHNFQTIIRPGTYLLNSQMSYQQIAILIIN